MGTETKEKPSGDEIVNIGVGGNFRSRWNREWIGTFGVLLEQIVVNFNGLPLGVRNIADDNGGLLAGEKEVDHSSVDTGLSSGYDEIILWVRDIGYV